MTKDGEQAWQDKHTSVVICHCEMKTFSTLEFIYRGPDFASLLYPHNARTLIWGQDCTQWFYCSHVVFHYQPKKLARQLCCIFHTVFSSVTLYTQNVTVLKGLCRLRQNRELCSRYQGCEEKNYIIVFPHSPCFESSRSSSWKNLFFLCSVPELLCDWWEIGGGRG